MIWFLVLVLITASVGQAVVWNEGIQGELNWDEALFIGNYTVALTDFSLDEAGPSKVLLDLQEHNKTIDHRAMQSGEWFIENDSIKVTVEEITRGEAEDDPSAKIRVQLPAAAELSLILSGDRDEFQGGDEMRLKLRVENKGIVDAENLKITLDSVPSCINARYRISKVSAGRAWDENKGTNEIDPIQVNLRAPYLPEPTDLSIRVRAEYADPEGIAYESFGGGIYRILGPLQFHKRAEELQDCPQNYFIVNSMRNSGNRTLDLKITDSTGSDFHTNSSLSWQLSLPPGETKIESYRIEAKKTGMGLSLPAAQASYVWQDKGYVIRSEMPVIDVFGPLIEATRSISPSKIKPGDLVKITIKFENTGNKKAAVIWDDSVPQGAEIVTGKTNGSFRLSPNETSSSEYQLRALKPGTIRFPPTQICYRDVRGDEYDTNTRAQDIRVEAEKVIVNASNNSFETDREDSIGSGTGNEVESGTGNGFGGSSQSDRGMSALGESNMLILVVLIVAFLSLAISRYS